MVIYHVNKYGDEFVWLDANQCEGRVRELRMCTFGKDA